MINWRKLNSDVDAYKCKYRNALPFPHLIIDGVCNEKLLKQATSEIPDPLESKANTSNDFIFAKNKFETPHFDTISPLFATLHEELLSKEFSNFLSKIAGEEIIVDPSFHGGGLHQGGKGSFLTMHADFDYHPQNLKWFRNLNILIYLNENWLPEYGGELKLRNGDISNGETYKIAPVFNRMVIMQTRGNTIHGYDEINFPDNEYRRSIASYGYTLMQEEGRSRTTIWHVEDANPMKRLLGKKMPYLVKLKHRLFGSRTGKS